MSITRPALSDEWVQLNAAHQVELKLKTPWRDGTSHLVMGLLEFMQRLAAPVPRPRLHVIRFHGVLARMPNCGRWWCPNGRPRRHKRPARPQSAECEIQTALARPGRISWARLLKRVFEIDM